MNWTLNTFSFVNKANSMITPQHKSEITTLVLREKDSLGTQRAVANKADVSEATINLILNGNTRDIADKMWQKIAAALGYSPSGWQLVQTTNTSILCQVFADAKATSAFMAVSHKAGSGKTSSAKSFYAQHASAGVYLIQCREWNKRQFLVKLCQTLGLETGRGWVSADDLIDSITTFFKRRVGARPLLIIDEADKLRPAALRTLIPLYNECEEQVGVVILGTDNLEKELKAGVRYNHKGFDELDSRFGRRFVHLIGATQGDIAAICAANGITDKAKYKAIFKECEPKVTIVENKQVQIVEDLRRLKRIIERELLMSAQEPAQIPAPAGQ